MDNGPSMHVMSAGLKGPCQSLRRSERRILKLKGALVITESTFRWGKMANAYKDAAKLEKSLVMFLSE